MKGSGSGNNKHYKEDARRAVVLSICHDVIENKISFNQAIENSEITLVTFYDWLLKDEELQKTYKYAREVRSDVLFEEIVEIADHTEEGVKTKITAAGIEETHGDMTEHRKLKIDARKWVVAKMQPKKYGEKIDVTSGDEPLKQNINVIVDTSETAETLKRLRDASSADQRISQDG